MLAGATTTELSKAIGRKIFLKVKRLPVEAAAMPVGLNQISKRISTDRSLYHRTPHSLMP